MQFPSTNESDENRSTPNEPVGDESTCRTSSPEIIERRKYQEIDIADTEEDCDRNLYRRTAVISGKLYRPAIYRAIVPTHKKLDVTEKYNKMALKEEILRFPPRTININFNLRGLSTAADHSPSEPETSMLIPNRQADSECRISRTSNKTTDSSTTGTKLSFRRRCLACLRRWTRFHFITIIIFLISLGYLIGAVWNYFFCSGTTKQEILICETVAQYLLLYYFAILGLTLLTHACFVRRMNPDPTDFINMRQMKGKTKETNKQKKERKKEFLENKKYVFSLVLPTLIAIFFFIFIYIYLKTKPKYLQE